MVRPRDQLVIFFMIGAALAIEPEAFSSTDDSNNDDDNLKAASNKFVQLLIEKEEGNGWDEALMDFNELTSRIGLEELVGQHLQRAILDDDLAHVEWILEQRGDDCARYDVEGEPLIYTAIKFNRAAIAKLLAESGADVNEINAGSHDSVLDVALISSYTELVLWLLEQGAESHAVNLTQQTPLHFAAMNANLALVEFFLARGADVNARDMGNRTALHMVMEINGESREPAVNRYKEAMEAKGVVRPPQHPSEHSDEVGTAKALLAAGADMDVRDFRGLDPLMLAAVNRNYPLVTLLLQHGADPLIDVDGQGEMRLSQLANEAGYSHPEHTAEFLEYGDNTKLHAWLQIHREHYTDRPKSVVQLVGRKARAQTRFSRLMRRVIALKEKEAPFLGKYPEWSDSTAAMMHDAILGDDTYAVLKLLLIYGDSHAADTFQSYPFVYTATMLGRFEIVRKLIAAGADMNAATPKTGVAKMKGRSLLDIAIMNGYTELALWLLERNATSAGSVETPLHLAAQMGNVRVVKWLLHHGGLDANALDGNGYSPLHAAAEMGKEERQTQMRIYAELAELATAKGYSTRTIPPSTLEPFNPVATVEALIEAGADVSIKTGGYIEPLMLAVKRQNYEVVEALVKRGVDCILLQPVVPKQGGDKILARRLSAMVVDAGYKWPDETVAYLQSGELPLLLMAEDRLEFFTQLRRKYAPERLANALLHAIIDDRLSALLRILLFHGAEHASGRTGTLPLTHSAAELGRLEILRELIAHGADINSINTANGRSLLDAAILLGRTDVAIWLMERGAKTHRDSVLHLAAGVGHVRLVKWMVEQSGVVQMDVNARNARGDTALHCVARLGSEQRLRQAEQHEEITKNAEMRGSKVVNPSSELDAAGTAEALIEAGADVTILDSNGLDPLLVAAKWQNWDVAEVLLKHGADPTIRHPDGRKTRLSTAILNSPEDYSWPDGAVDYLKSRHFNDGENEPKGEDPKAVLVTRAHNGLREEL